MKKAVALAVLAALALWPALEQPAAQGVWPVKNGKEVKAVYICLIDTTVAANDSVTIRFPKRGSQTVDGVGRPVSASSGSTSRSVPFVQISTAVSGIAIFYSDASLGQREGVAATICPLGTPSVSYPPSGAVFPGVEHGVDSVRVVAGGSTGRFMLWGWE